jgi:outer membrane murein-binding lipoprotein Lpp
MRAAQGINPMSYIATILQEFPAESQASMLKFAEALEQSLRQQFAVRREDIDALRSDVRELAAAQQRSEQRLDRIEAVVERLVVAQERTEQRIEELALAQQRSEQRLDQLEETMERLAAAQERTERELHSLVGAVEKLADEHQETRRQLGGLTMTIGYQLEDLAYKALPGLLLRDYDLAVQGRLQRGYVADSKNKPREVNILGTARRNGDLVTIVGESKAQLSKNDVDRFVRRTVEPLTGVYEALFPILVTYMTSEPDADAYARAQNIALYYSYDF